VSALLLSRRGLKPTFDKLPPLLRIGNGIIHRWRNSRLNARHPVLAYGFLIAHAPQSLWTRKPPIARSAHAAKWQRLVEVVYGKVVYADHTRFDFPCNLLQAGLVVTKYACAEAVHSSVCDRNGVVDVLSTHDNADGRECFLLCNFHLGSNVYEQRRLEIMA